jgi:prepilin-type N-terminal cleavage/methylation domain-containing protein
MRRIFPVRICNPEAGFSLVEVIVATAVTAMAIAAATTSILASQKVQAASSFYREALFLAETTHVNHYGSSEENGRAVTGKAMTVEEEVITSDEAERIPIWNMFTVRDKESGRRMTFSIHTGALP